MSSEPAMGIGAALNVLGFFAKKSARSAMIERIGMEGARQKLVESQQSCSWWIRERTSASLEMINELTSMTEHCESAWPDLEEVGATAVRILVFCGCPHAVLEE